MSYGYIYKITNSVTGDCYVGQTTQSVATRFKQHLYQARYEDQRQYSHLYRAMAKYGVDVFSVRQICRANTQTELNHREAVAMRVFKSSYNIRAAGSNGKLSCESKKKLSDAHRGKKRGPHTDETRRKIAMSNTGRKASAETRKKLSIAHLGSFNPKLAKGIVIFDFVTQSFMEFPTQRMAAAILGVKRTSLSNAAVNNAITVKKRYKVVSLGE